MTPFVKRGFASNLKRIGDYTARSVTMAGLQQSRCTWRRQMKHIRLSLLLAAAAAGWGADTNLVTGTAPSGAIDSTTGAANDPRQLKFKNTATGSNYNWTIGTRINASDGFEITPSSLAGGSTYSTPTAVFTTDGKVGIGSTSPSERLDLTGSGNANIKIQQGSWIGYGNSTSQLAFLGTGGGSYLWAGNTRLVVGGAGASPSYTLDVPDGTMHVKTTTNTSSFIPTVAVEGVAIGPGNVYGCGLELNENGSGGDGSGEVHGISSTASVSGSFTSATAIEAIHGMGGSTGTLANSYGLKVTPKTTGGTISNCYDIYIASPSNQSAIATHFSLYQSNASAKNYFAGNVGIGTTAPAKKLDVSGTVGASGDVVFTSTTASTSTSTGALVVSGGIGCAQTSYFNGLVNMSTNIMNQGTTETWLYTKATSASANNRLTRFGNTSSGDVAIQLVDDGISAASDVMRASRSGNTVTQVAFPAGNVGIGTASPGVKLDVVGTVRSDSTFTCISDGSSTASVFSATTATTNAKCIRVANTGADFYLGTESSSAGGFFTGSSAYDSCVWTGGRLFLRGASGVATPSVLSVTNTTASTNPSSGALVVTGGAGVGGDMYVGGSRLQLSSTSSSDALTVCNTTDTTHGSFFYAQSGNGTTSARYAASTYRSNESSPQQWTAGMYGSKDYVVLDDTAGIYPLTIKQGSGNIGLGTLSPGQKLSVAGTLGILETGTSPQYYTVFQGGDQSANVTYTLPIGLPGGNGWALTCSTAGVMSWTDPGAGGAGWVMNEKAKQLDVEGEVRCASLVVMSDHWGDDVLEPGYALAPLADVASFIKDNRHLPGVPAEQDVVSKGISVGSMAEVQIRKIEELTLYAIQQDKQMAELKAQNETLMKRLEALEAKAK